MFEVTKVKIVEISTELLGFIGQLSDQSMIGASFWAGCRFIKYPEDMDALELVLWARNHGAEYMVVNVKVVHHLAKGLDPLLTSPLPPDLADKVTLVELLKYDLVEHNTAIYRINDPLPQSR